MENCVALESPQMERAVIFFALLSAAPVAAQISGQDVRNTSIPDMNTHFQMPVFTSRAEWLEKAAFLRKQILSSAGLLPMPEKTPLRAQIDATLHLHALGLVQVAEQIGPPITVTNKTDLYVRVLHFKRWYSQIPACSPWYS